LVERRTELTLRAAAHPSVAADSGLRRRIACAARIYNSATSSIGADLNLPAGTDGTITNLHSASPAALHAANFQSSALASRGHAGLEVLPRLAKFLPVGDLLFSPCDIGRVHPPQMDVRRALARHIVEASYKISVVAGQLLAARTIAGAITAAAAGAGPVEVVASAVKIFPPVVFPILFVVSVVPAVVRP
jgi:hypothetical protein